LLFPPKDHLFWATIVIHYFRLLQAADVVASKPTVSVSGDEGIDSIPNASGNQFANEQRFPKEAKRPRDFDSGVAHQVSLTVFEQHQGRHFRRVQSEG